MPYIGNRADTAFTSLEKQDFSNPSGTSLTLTHAVANANDIALYINNVRQEPTEAYSVNGTTVTLTGSVVSTDDIYVIYLARAVQTTVPPDGSVGTAKIADAAVTNAKIANSTIDLTSKVTGILPTANGGIGYTSTTRPAFSVRLGSTGATNSSNVFSATVVEHFNQGSHFKSSGTNDGKFVAPVAGLYLFRVEGFTSDGNNQNTSANTITLHLTKNGDTLSDIAGRLAYSYNRYEDHQPITLVEFLVLSANDAIGVRINQGYLYNNNNTTSPAFSGCLIG